MIVTTALYPRTYDPSFATGACVLAIVFASTFSLIFPLIGPAVVLLLFLTLIGGQSITHSDCRANETYEQLIDSSSATSMVARIPKLAGFYRSGCYVDLERLSRFNPFFLD